VLHGRSLSTSEEGIVHQVSAGLTDGGTVLLRPMARDESAPLLSVFDGLSAR